MITSGASTRSEKNFLAFYGSNSETASATLWFGMPSAAFCVGTNSDGEKTYKVVCGENSTEIKNGEWFNIRYEFDNTSVVGNEIRVYVNGELLHTGTNTKTTTALRFIRIMTPSDSTGDIYLDNTFFSAVTAE